MSANDKQIGGAHYAQAGAWQHWDFVTDARLGYLAGNATKYLARHRRKHGAQDLAKAAHYIEKMIEQVQAGALVADIGRRPSTLDLSDALYKLVQVYNLSDAESMACRLLCTWYDAADLRHALAIVLRLANSMPTADDGAGPTGRGYVAQD
jgi:hypothetical protein